MGPLAMRGMQKTSSARMDTVRSLRGKTAINAASRMAAPLPQMKPQTAFTVVSPLARASSAALSRA